MGIKTLLMQNVAYPHYLCNVHIIKPASKHCNDVILSDAKNLVFSCCYEILHSVQDDNYNCRVNIFRTNMIFVLLQRCCYHAFAAHMPACSDEIYFPV
jgi:hypothetical protein